MTTQHPTLQNSPYTINRQAVVIIHGIGNQKPMDTLRPFVDAVLDVDHTDDQDPKYYSKPDDLSGTFELRRLQSRDSRPRTDYFELYWQHLVPTATWSKIWAWLTLLLTRPPSDVPPSLRGLWIITWVIAILGILFMLLTVVVWLFPGQISAPDGFPVDVTYPLGVTVVLGIIEGIILNSVGDAAIYLSPQADNIKARQDVREAGVALIERLHAGLDRKRPYDRIVIVGHSLGSIIGYDILTYAWPRFNNKHGRLDRPSQDALDDTESAAKNLWKAANGTNPTALQQAREAWTYASRLLWLEQRYNRFPWLVTDFITLGSPLTHAMLLLARNRTEFERKKLQRELLTCPPTMDGGRFSFPINYRLKDKSPRTTRAMHHAALFAVTRWTNLFFPVRFGIKGDFVGGPLSGTLGPGIIDVPVVTASRGGWLAHTKYWRLHRLDRQNPRSAIARLILAIDISCRSFSELFPNGSKQNKQKPNDEKAPENAVATKELAEKT